MKKTEKLKLQIDNLPVMETTYAKLPTEFQYIAEKLEQDGNEYGAVCVVYVDKNANQSYCISLDYVGKVVKAKEKLFGQDEKEFIARQYK